MAAVRDPELTERRVTACPFCGGHAKRWLQAWDRNRELGDGRFRYDRCLSCSSVFLANVPGDLARYYGGDYYRFDDDGEPLWRHEPAQEQAASYRIQLIRRHAAPGELIEIGAGTGAFAIAAKAAGFSVTALEMDERCCEYLRDRGGIRAIHTDRPAEALGSLPAARVVTLWHVLEHLPDAAGTLAAAVAKLEPEGLIAITVPNTRSLQFRVFGRRWAHLDAPRHLCLIPPDALLERARELGLRAVAMTTNDPDGLACNLLGWYYGLQSRPARGSPSWLSAHLALNLSRAFAPLERTGLRGSAISLLLQKVR